MLFPEGQTQSSFPEGDDQLGRSGWRRGHYRASGCTAYTQGQLDSCLEHAVVFVVPFHKGGTLTTSASSI